MPDGRHGVRVTGVTFGAAGRRAGLDGARSAPMRHSPTPPRHAQLRAGHAAAWVTAVGLALLAAWLIVSGAPAAHAAGSAQVQQQLSTSRQHVTALSGDLAAAKGRVTQLTSGITSLSSPLAA